MHGAPPIGTGASSLGNLMRPEGRWEPLTFVLRLPSGRVLVARQDGGLPVNQIGLGHGVQGNWLSEIILGLFVPVGSHSGARAAPYWRCASWLRLFGIQFHWVEWRLLPRKYALWTVLRVKGRECRDQAVLGMKASAPGAGYAGRVSIPDPSRYKLMRLGKTFLAETWREPRKYCDNSLDWIVWAIRQFLIYSYICSVGVFHSWWGTARFFLWPSKCDPLPTTRDTLSCPRFIKLHSLIFQAPTHSCQV